MITRIRGVLEEIGDDGVVILPGSGESGIAHEVRVPAYLRRELENSVGDEITLHTREYLEPVSQGSSFVPRLIGFASAEDRRFFEVFTSVKGVGPRKALRAMSEPVGVIAGAISRRDSRALIALPEIGKRTAETIIAELSGKVERFIHAAATVMDSAGAQLAGGDVSAWVEQAVSAMVRLGEPRNDAERLVKRAIEQEPKPSSVDDVLTAAFALRV